VIGNLLDFIDAAMAENVNGRKSGPAIDQLGLALAELVQRANSWGMSIGQLDPAHATAHPTALPRLIAALATSFIGPR
jgi:arginase